MDGDNVENSSGDGMGMTSAGTVGDGDKYLSPCSCLLRTSWNCENQSQVSQHSNISDPPSDSSWLYRATSSATIANGLSVWPACRSAIHCRTACGI